MRRTKRNQVGFTLMEVLVASIVLLIGIVAVAQLVPVSVGLNASNRRDTTSLVIAQRELDALMSQPVTNATFTDRQGLTCAVGAVCNLGVAAAAPACTGNCPPVMFGPRPFINYNAAAVAGYNLIYTDPDDPSGGSFDIRWAVITFANGGTPYGKRFIVGVRRIGGNGSLFPVALDSMVEK